MVCTMELVARLVVVVVVVVEGRVHPVVLVPGDGGSQVEGRLNKTRTVHYLCDKTSDWFTLWLNLEQLVPEVVDCWVDNMKLVYEPEAHRSRDNHGVETRIPGFGNSSTVEYLDPSQRFFSIYFATLVRHLLPQVGARAPHLLFRATRVVPACTARPTTSARPRTSTRSTLPG